MGKQSKIGILILAAMVLTVPWFRTLSAEDGDQISQVLGGIRENYGKLPGLAVPYSREVITRSMAMMGARTKGDLATGWIYFKPPDLLRLEQETPTREFLITDGSTLWWYIPDQNRAYRYDQESFGKEMKLLGDLFHGLQRANERFQVNLALPRDGEYELELRPEPLWEQVDSIVVTLDKGYVIRRVDIHNSLGGITRFRLEPVTEKPSFAPDFFHFVPPQGVEVVDDGAG